MSLLMMPAEKLQVHPDNYVQLKLVILKHLPILGQYPWAFYS